MCTVSAGVCYIRHLESNLRKHNLKVSTFEIRQSKWLVIFHFLIIYFVEFRENFSRIITVLRIETTRKLFKIILQRTWYSFLYFLVISLKSISTIFHENREFVRFLENLILAQSSSSTKNVHNIASKEFHNKEVTTLL